MPKSVSEVLLYGTLGCHLCDDAFLLGKDALPDNVVIRHVDIVEDEGLINSMANRIPVMKVGDLELNWPFEKKDIQNAWRQRPTRRRYLL